MANDENLIPAKKGDIRNPNGKPKGIKNWSTIVQKLLADENLAEKVLKNKPAWWNDLPNKNIGYALAMAMMTKAMSGDSKAAEWVRKTGFGDKLDITTKGKPIPILGGASVPDNYRDQEDTESSEED